MTNQFDNNFKINYEMSDNSNILKKLKFIEEEQIRIQKEIPNRPSNISFFESLMYDDKIRLKTDGPRVGYYCNIIPEEIILAFGAVPIRLDCGNNVAASTGEEIFAGDICPLAKASVGNMLYKNSLANSCDLLIVPTSCDAKRKMGEVLNDFKPTFMLNLPCEQNHEAYIKQSVKELYKLIKFLETHLKKKLSSKLLRAAVGLTQQRTILMRKLHEEKIQKPNSISIRDIFLIIQSAQFRPFDLNQWLKEAEKTVNELTNFIPNKKSLKPKLILTGAPIVWPNFKILNLIEESGANIVSDTLCSGMQSVYDPITSGEKSTNSILYALANRYIYAAICPCFISQTTRINRILELVDESSANGVINYSLRLCQLFDIENYRNEKILKSKKIPYLNIRTDYSLEDKEQLRVRIEAFLETLY
ncbi:2-hydroxyacyl-CoA dehydratase subunit D [bacterium]